MSCFMYGTDCPVIIVDSVSYFRQAKFLLDFIFAYNFPVLNEISVEKTSLEGVTNGIKQVADYE